MLKRMLSRVFSSESTATQMPCKPMVENLESRVFFHNGFIASGIADNRGEVQLTVDPDTAAEVSPSTFNKNSVQMYEAGPDGILANADDFRVAATVRFTPSNGRLLIRGPVTAGNGYRIKIVSSRVFGGAGFSFDGNFNGTFPSGDGAAGGNFEMQVKNDRSSTPFVRMYTTQGLITLRMRGDLAPNTFRNFLSYANSLRYDNIFFTRSENNPSPFVIQGGSLQITGDGNSASDVVATSKNPGIAEEFGNSNVRGTVAMAKSGVGNSSTTNQFFFNLVDNSFLDAQQFTVFAELYGASSLAVADAINAKPVADLTSQIGSDPSTGVSKVPVQNEALAETSLNPFRDLIYIRRTAVRSRIAAL